MTSDNDEKRIALASMQGSDTESAMRFWFRFGDHDVELPAGELFIGRSPRCHMVLDDPLVSRQHARVLVQTESVSIEDLDSVNGVVVNGERVTALRTLRSGDRVMIGQQSFVLHGVRSDLTGKRRYRMGAMTLSQGHETEALSEDATFAPSLGGERNEATRQGNALEMLTGVVEKVLALGRGDEAERILSHYLRGVLQTARADNHVDLEIGERAATYALRIAEATSKGAWADYVFELYTVARVPLPAPLTERLYTSLRSISGVNLGILRNYLAVLNEEAPRFSPPERFLVRRLQGLLPLVASR